ncbi:hypothetical protein [Dyella sp.]|uniref:hypothetical protein n=1 Tax=Dyella sp. TaxID=1869338 RepID=UPI002FDA2742
MSLASLIVVSACGSSMNTPDIKHSPHPKMRYEITLMIKDAPGPFESVKGYMLYKVVNEQCSPFEEFAGIYRPPPDQDLPFTLTRVNNQEYKGVIYLDLLQDADYYGKGVCHWNMPFVLANLKVGEVTFAPDMSQSQIIQQQSIPQYFPKKAYGDNSIKNMGYAGSTMSDVVARYREEFFSITLSAKEHFE